jgi:hypothetical protein
MRAIGAARRAAERRLPRAAGLALLRFLRQAGPYHAAALTYYAILLLFPAAGLVYALLGLVGADAAIGDAGEALEPRAFEPQFDALERTVRSAVDQRYGDAALAFAISAAVALFVAGRWLRAADRALDTVLEREPRRGGWRIVTRTRDTAALVLLVSGALLLAFAGSALNAKLFGDPLPLLRTVGAAAAATAVAIAAYAYLYAFVPSPAAASARRGCRRCAVGRRDLAARNDRVLDLRRLLAGLRHQLRGLRRPGSGDRVALPHQRLRAARRRLRRRVGRTLSDDGCGPPRSGAGEASSRLRTAS